MPTSTETWRPTQSQQMPTKRARFKPLKDLRRGDLVVHPKSAHYLILEDVELRPADPRIQTTEKMISVRSTDIYIWRVPESAEGEGWELAESVFVAIWDTTYVVREDGVYKILDEKKESGKT